MFDDPSAAAADLAGWAEQMQHKAQRFQVLQGRLAQLSVTETSADNSVRVTIDSNGVPTDIRFTDGIRRKNPAALSAEVMSCLSRARGTLVGQVTATVHDVVGDDPIGANIIEQFGGRLADSAPAPGGVPAPASADRRAPEPSWSQPDRAAPIWSEQPQPEPRWNEPAPSRPEPPQPPPTPPQPRPSAPPPPSAPTWNTAPPPPATPASLVPDVEDEEGEYYRNKSWLV
ncbi:YbaB/EbfC family nucleoid-associated protein [Nocardia sp. NPDC019395]|uniref:YbaB/EbfC family nucleoid-associated protein n=1 Tax=Nocardia sp. NPDC019395 TaxID=3154686 RepID=UPI0033C0732A